MFLAFWTASKISVETNPLIIISFYFVTLWYQSTIHLACKCFKSDNFDDILTSVGSVPFWSYADTWLANQSLYLFWMNAFAVLLTDKSKDWNSFVRLWGTITTSQLFSPHSSLKASLFWCHARYLSSRENYLFEKLHRFLCVRPMIFCKHYRKGGRKRKFWESSFGFHWIN